MLKETGDIQKNMCNLCGRYFKKKIPDDFVISTNKSYSVRYFVEEAYKNIGVKIKWVGKGRNEKGIDKKTNKTIISINKKYFRPNEVDYLKGTLVKQKKNLNGHLKFHLNNLLKK